MRCVLFLFIVISFIASYVPAGTEASSGTSITNAVGQGVAGTVKGVGKAIFLGGKGVYKVAEYLVVELLRPVRAIGKKAADKWGCLLKSDWWMIRINSKINAKIFENQKRLPGGG